MVFVPPSYIPELQFPPPDSVAVHDFLWGDNVEKYNRYPIAKSLAPFTCGVTGKSYAATEIRPRIEHLARAIAKETSWEVDSGTEFDKVVAIFGINTIDTVTVTWATHRLNGAASLASTAYAHQELVHHFNTSGAKILFTCGPVLDRALAAADAVGIPRRNIYLLEVPSVVLNGQELPKDLKTVDQLIEEGKALPPLPELKWTPGQGERQTAFLCSSSGTSGLPKSVKISHRNVIANVLQAFMFEGTYKSPEPELSLGVLPFSHNFALMIVAHLNLYRGDGVVLMPNFDLIEVLKVIQKYRLGRLWMVPPMIAAMLKAPAIVQQYDLSCVNHTVVGAAILSLDIRTRFHQMLPNSKLTQGYGLTETTVCVTFENPHDMVFGSLGHLFPSVEARLIDETGDDIEGYDTPGELLLRAPNIMLGYYKNEAETRAMLREDGWLRTGDLVEFRKSPNGHDHVFLIDRVKELIKVRGNQVSPAELEDYLMLHPSVGDATVVPVPDETAGELPMAFIVKSPAAKEEDNDVLAEQLRTYVEKAFAQHKRLAGGIEFRDALPKSVTGKTKRGVLKTWAKDVLATREKAAAVASTVQVFDFDDDDEDDDDEDEDEDDE